MSRFVSVTLAACSLLATAFAIQPVDVNVLYSFGNGTWAENLAVRANGQILVSRLDTPEILQLDPTGVQAPVTVASWDPATYMGCLGISETTPDKFYVVVSGFVNDSFVLTSGVNSIWEIDMTTFACSTSPSKVVSNATISKLADIPTSDFLNGLTTLSPTSVLAADSYNGWVYRVDTQTGDYIVAVNDTKMKFNSIQNPTVNIGVNGIKIHDGYLYWTNTAIGSLDRIRITDKGVPFGKSEVVVNNVPKADDFVFKKDGVAFIAQNQMDELSVLYPEWSAAKVIAGSNTSTVLAGVTAGRFGRSPTNENILYLTTSGGTSSHSHSVVLLSQLTSEKLRLCLSMAR